MLTRAGGGFSRGSFDRPRPLIGASAPFCDFHLDVKKAPSGDGADVENTKEQSGVRTVVLRIGAPKRATLSRSLTSTTARFRSDAYSDAVHPRLTIRPAQYRSQRAPRSVRRV